MMMMKPEQIVLRTVPKINLKVEEDAKEDLSKRPRNLRKQENQENQDARDLIVANK